MNKELVNDNLRETHWLGEVVVNEDPLLQGRVRVKVFGKFDKLFLTVILMVENMFDGYGDGEYFFVRR